MIIAIVVAVAAGLLTVRFLTAVQPAPAPTPVAQMRAVIVASRDIHPHEKIVPEMLAKVQRNADQVQLGSISDPKIVEGDVSLIAIPEGAPVTTTEVGVPASIGITGKLVPGMRAVSIPVDFVKSVSGFVEPGDRVDVLASTVRGEATRTIIRGALVLAVNSSLDPQAEASPQVGGQAPAPATPVAVTLDVTPAQADELTYADLNTTLRLALRSPSESILAFPVQPLVIAPATTAHDMTLPLGGMPAPNSSAPAATPTPGITVIEGSEVARGTM
jgi:pilus assembly protein CpaB